MNTITVYHSYYGCDTGCCGHRIELFKDGESQGEHFVFDHPLSSDEKDTEKMREWAKKLLIEEFGEEHCADLDWENSNISKATGDC